MSGGARLLAVASAPRQAELARAAMVDIRSQCGELLRRVATADAQRLAAAGLGEWVGAGRRRYVRLLAESPSGARVRGLYVGLAEADGITGRQKGQVLPNTYEFK